MRHGAIAAQLLSAIPVPEAAGLIAVIDFANGVYEYQGLPVDVLDLLEADQTNWQDFDVVNIIAGLGLKHPPSGGTGSGPVFKGALLAQMLDGCTIVLDIHMGSGGFTLIFAVFPGYDNLWNFDISVGGSPNIFTDYDATFVESEETLPDNTNHKVAVTMRPGKFSISTDGGTVDTAAPSANGTPFTDVAFNAPGTSGSPTYVRSIKVYGPQPDSALPGLSLPDALAGAAPMTLAAVAALVAEGALAGAAPLALGGSASLGGEGALAGTAPVALGASGTLDLPSGETSGAAAMTLGASATLSGDGALAGSAAIVTAASGTLDQPANPVRTYRGRVTSGGSASIGTASADRLVVGVIAHKRSSAPGRSVSSATIGGVSATIHEQRGADGNAIGLAIISAVVPTGTTATVSVTLSGAVTDGPDIEVYTITGLNSTTPTDTIGSAGSSDNPSGNIDVEAGGVIIGGACGNANNAVSWTGLTEDADAVLSGGAATRLSVASISDATVETNRSVSITSSSAAEILLAAAWR